MTGPIERLRPGSDEALAAGCTCPVIDNHYGRGWGGQPGVFVMTADCPLHGAELLALPTLTDALKEETR